MKTLASIARLLALLTLAFANSASAASYVDNPPALIDRLTPEVLEMVFPNAGRLAPIEGPPAAVAVYDDTDVIVGYIFSTLDTVRARGYSFTPFDVLAGVSADGLITGVSIVFNPEPHIDGDARRTALLDRFFSSFISAPYNELSESTLRPDVVAGATISARSMRYAIGDASRSVMRALFGAPVVTEPTLDVEAFTPQTFDELLADGSIRSMTISNADLDAALAAEAPDAVLETRQRGEPDEIYIEFLVALATPPMIGRNLITSQHTFDRIATDYPEGTQAILLASNGRYNFQGVKHQNASSGFLFDRVEIEQGETVHVFHGEDYFRAAGRMGTYSGVLVVGLDSGFDPLSSWTASLKVHGATPDGAEVTLSFPLEYQLPAAHILMPEPEPEAVWITTWRDARGDLIVLGGALLVLTLIFAFQAKLSRYRVAHRWIRNGFLIFTVAWIGYVAGAQLSIVNVINYVKGPFEGVDVGFYLTEPLIVVLAAYVLVSLVLIGRGVFCGWLCPFGALQELLSKVGRFFRLPEWNPSARAQRWMWLPKYGVAVAVVGTAFVVPEWAMAAQEVEPFKTAITSVFTRPWPYVTYAVLLLGVGLFTERAFCRFLCPLGAILAVLGRLHLFNPLKRRPQCGSPCQLCERSCPVKAIEPNGAIIAAECFQCLDCQVEYYDDRRCPPLAEDRKQRERTTTRRPIGKAIPAYAQIGSV